MTNDEARQALGGSKAPFADWNAYLEAKRKEAEAEAMLNAGPTLSKEERRRDAIAAEYQRIINAASASSPKALDTPASSAPDWYSSRFGAIR